MNRRVLGLAAALAVAGISRGDARADVLIWKNLPADKDVVLYQSGDRDLRSRVVLCFWLRAELGKFKVQSDRFQQPVELAQGDKDKPEQRVLCGSLITVRAESAENALQYAIAK
ncbi:MAG: hypothetical protein ACT4N4_16165 [Rhodospirillales bacterium]